MGIWTVNGSAVAGMGAPTRKESPAVRVTITSSHSTGSPLRFDRNAAHPEALRRSELLHVSTRDRIQSQYFLIRLVMLSLDSLKCLLLYLSQLESERERPGLL